MSKNTAKWISFLSSVIAVGSAVYFCLAVTTSATTLFYVWLWEILVGLLIFISLGVGFRKYWFGIIIDARNRISLSRLQMATWTILFAATLLVFFLWNLGHAKSAQDVATAMALNIPDTTWILMGMAGVSAAASPLILSQKPDALPVNVSVTPAPAAGPQQGVNPQNVPPVVVPPLPANPPAPHPLVLPIGMELKGVVLNRQIGRKPEWSDIILGDEAGNGCDIDLSKVQQLIFTGVAVITYAVAILRIIHGQEGHINELPSMNSGFLALLGASHATYLAYKVVPHT